MGLTAADGLVMGTRCGVTGLGRADPPDGPARHGDARAEDLIHRRSGLPGASGISRDMRALCASPAPEAAEAITLFAYRIVRESPHERASVARWVERSEAGVGASDQMRLPQPRADGRLHDRADRTTIPPVRSAPLVGRAERRREASTIEPRRRA